MTCLLKTIWYSIPTVLHGYTIDGHSYIETYRNKDVEVLECDRCGYTTVAYFE